jgi:L-lysine exporter family protein LysE/ArgO
MNFLFATAGPVAPVFRARLCPGPRGSSWPLARRTRLCCARACVASTWAAWCCSARVADAVLIVRRCAGHGPGAGRTPRAGPRAGPGRRRLPGLVYGWQALQTPRTHRRAATGTRPGGGAGPEPRRGAGQAAAFTLLNPHVYLDTVLLVGSIGAQQPAALRGWFMAGASMCQPALVQRCSAFGRAGWRPGSPGPRAWQVLDGLIGVTMLGHWRC